MIIGRLLAYIFLCLMIMVLGAEGLKLLEGNNGGWIPVSQVIDFISSTDLSRLVSRINDNGESSIGKNILVFLLSSSAFLGLMFLSGILFFLSRNKNR
ncbi:MAG: hypothetical protein JKY84_12515 [Emcibacteraceae bacterium]|nr:hypothetical protein [Emcibacteraceae bacterium]